MFCGTGIFPRVEEDDDHNRDHRRSSTMWSRHGNKKRRNNPYSSRGLDKFYNVLADLDALRQKIATEKENPVMFVYSGSHQWVPIVLKLQDPWKKKAKTYHGDGSRGKSLSTQLDSDPKDPVKEAATTATTIHGDVTGEIKQKEKRRRWMRSSIGCSHWSSWILLVLILLFLALFGKTSSICLTTAWWYAVPAIRGGEERKKIDDTKKRGYRRRTVSEKNLGSGVRFASFRPPINGRISQQHQLLIHG